MDQNGGDDEDVSPDDEEDIILDDDDEDENDPIGEDENMDENSPVDEKEDIPLEDDEEDEDADPEVDDDVDEMVDNDEQVDSDDGCPEGQMFDNLLCRCVSSNQCAHDCAPGLYEDPIGENDSCECLEFYQFVALYNHGLDENCEVPTPTPASLAVDHSGSPIVLNFYGNIYGDVSGVSGNHNTIVGSVPIGELDTEEEAGDDEGADDDEATEGAEPEEADGTDSGEG